MPMATDELILRSRERILALARQHGATEVRVFGSMATGDAGANSDVDLLVELEEGRDLFDLGAFQMDVQDLLNRHVDIVTEGALHRLIREKVLLEAVYL